MSSPLKRILRDLLFPNREQHPIPVMDGHLSPNDRLDRCSELAHFDDAPDDLAWDSSGALLVSAGQRVLRASAAGAHQWDSFCQFEQAVGGLAMHPDGRLLVCVSGRGLAAVAPDGRTSWLTAAQGAPILCPTAVVAASDGSIYLCDGSATHLPADWSADLLGCQASGRLIRCDADLGQPEVLQRGLAYPHGCALSSDQSTLVFTESWAHTVTSLDRASGQTSKLVRNLPGYPARIATASDGGFWLALFGMRTHLLELVLDDAPFRQQMMATVPPQHWIAPALRATGSYLEPLQGGGIKKLGIVKPWAPPRSYGLVLRMAANGDSLESLHSRVGGLCHGVTAARPHGRRLLIVSKGHQRLLQAPLAEN